MLKYALLLALFAAGALAMVTSVPETEEADVGGRSVSSTPDSRDQDDEVEPLTLGAFREEMNNVRDNAIGAANRIDDVLGHAITAIHDVSGNSWVGFEDNFKSMMEEVSETFAQEEKRMMHVIRAFWDKPQGFVKVRYCNNVASLYEHRAESTNLELDFMVAMLTDLGCLKEEFTTAENIPIEAMVDGEFTETDAVQVIQGTFQKMYEIKRQGEDFGDALEKMDQEINGGSDSQAKYDRRTVRELIRFLKSFNRK